MIPRHEASLVALRLAESAGVALLGPRQIGKTTLARDLAESWPTGSIYLDLERPADRRRLDDADAYLRAQAPRLVVLDEVHRMPDLFEVLRGVIDDNRRAGHRTGQFLLLGSASFDLIRRSSESLAGRLAHVDLAGIAPDEAVAAGIDSDRLWLRGGYPESLTARTDEGSARWRADLIRTYLEREVPMFAPRIPAETLRRLWTMVAHTSGGLLNSARFAASLGISGPTVDRYLDLLADLGLVRRLPPWHVNTSKRVTKAPKMFVRDSGLLHALLELQSLDEVLSHPSAGASYESFVVESLISAAPDGWRPFHYRTARGDEVDLAFVRGTTPVLAVEVKRSSAPTVSAGFHRAVGDLGQPRSVVVHPDTGHAAYQGPGGTTVVGLIEMMRHLRVGLVDFPD